MEPWRPPWREESSLWSRNPRRVCMVAICTMHECCRARRDCRSRPASRRSCVSNQRCVGFRILAHKRQTSGIHSSGRLTRIPIERRRRKGALRAQARSDARLHAPRGLGQTSVYMTALHPDRGLSLGRKMRFSYEWYIGMPTRVMAEAPTHTPHRNAATHRRRKTRSRVSCEEVFRVCTDWVHPPQNDQRA